MTQTHTPPMDPSTDEADDKQLHLARVQGRAYHDAVLHMVEHVAQTGALRDAGDVTVAIAVEEAEGMHVLEDGELRWQEPEGNLHLEVAVLDRGDQRFVPGLDVTVTAVDADGREIGTHPHPMLWHPMILHYGRNWELPGSGTYTFRVHVEPAGFPRHDEVNGRRYTRPVDVEFAGIEVETGQD